MNPTPDLGFIRRRSPAVRGVDLGWIRRRTPALAPVPAPAAPAASLDLSAPRSAATSPAAAVAPAGPATSSGSLAADRLRPKAVALHGLVALSDERPSVLIGGEQAVSGSLQLSLTWNSVPADPRLAARGIRPSTDLWLGCLFQLADGTSGVLQHYDNGLDAAVAGGHSVLRLGGRSEQDGQTLMVALRHLQLLKRFVVFAYAVSGRPDLRHLDPSLIATLKGGVAIDLRPATPAEHDTTASIAALASLHRVGDVLVLRRERRLLAGQQQSVAEAYGFDLPWVGGRSVARLRLR